ncbi:hypothetical protein DFH27DRAFT_656200 [Peziza echinospora]|nr:hypothetical protein DFH27DRAFT_656200 [Peziza echinospora]
MDTTPATYADLRSPSRPQTRHTAHLSRYNHIRKNAHNTPTPIPLSLALSAPHLVLPKTDCYPYPPHLLALYDNHISFPAPYLEFSPATAPLPQSHRGTIPVSVKQRKKAVYDAINAASITPYISGARGRCTCSWCRQVRREGAWRRCARGEGWAEEADMGKRDMVGRWMYLVACGMGSRWGYLQDMRIGEGEEEEGEGGDEDEEVFLEGRWMERGEEVWGGLVDRAVEVFGRKGRGVKEEKEYEEGMEVEEISHEDDADVDIDIDKLSPLPSDLEIDAWYFFSDLSGSDDSDGDIDGAHSECSNDSWECL